VLQLMSLLCHSSAVNETLTIRLGKKLALALDHEVRQSGLAKQKIVRQALESRLQGSRKLAVMRRYFGTICGPPDLSTNKLYRRNWGKRQE
jgi:hypothetical protein